MKNEETKKKNNNNNEDSKPGREGTRVDDAEWKQRTGWSTEQMKAWTSESSWTSESMEKGGQGTGWNMDKIKGAWPTEVAHGPHRWSVNRADEA